MKVLTALPLVLPLWACHPAPDGDSAGRTPGGQRPPDIGESPSSPTPSGGTSFGGGAAGNVGPGTRSDSPALPARLAELRTAAKPPPPISGGSLAISPDGQHVAAADPDRDAVYLLELPAGELQKMTLSAGSEPGRVVFDDAGGVHVALRGSGKLVRIELSTASVGIETPLCEHPRGLAFDAESKLVVASCMDGELVELDAVSHRESARTTLPHDLRDVVLGGAGKRWVARYRSAELLGLQAGNSVRSTARPRSVATSGGIDGIELPDDVIRLLTDAGVGLASGGAEVASPALAWRALAGPSDSVWMLHQQSKDGEVAIERGGYGRGCQAITSGAVTEFTGDGTPSRSMPVALQGLSVDLALSPDEQWLALASPGGFAGSSPTIQVYSTALMRADPAPASGGCSAQPAATAGVEQQTVAVAFGADGLLFALSREPAQLTLYRLPGTSGMARVPASMPLTRTATFALNAGSVRDTGHDLFHADVGGGLACASCHGEALDDGHVWNFRTIGRRRTQNIRGGLLATAPFHWDGDMPTVGHLVDDVMTGRMGGFAIEPSYVAALGQWMDQQPALSLPVVDAAAVARGKDLFESEQTGCASCHSGPSFTNNESADVGTGGSFQVPSLRGLGLHAPYMHDGCAQTLAERFRADCGGDEHGDTSHLDAQQLADLVAYLSSL